MANLRTNNLCGEGGRNAIRGSVVFGGGDNSAAGLTIADNSELELGSETHWTIEFWLWLNGPTHGDYDVVLGKGSATGNNYEYFVEVMSDNTLEFLTTSTGSAWTFQQQISPVLSADSWHHVAVVRNGSGSNSLKSYINGQEYGSFTAENIHTSAYPFGIGYFAGGTNLYSKITLSNLRICKGHAVYTANFTPPFYELKSHYIDGDDKTVLLCCQDSDNPLQEATGKTITGVGHLANGAVIHPKNVPPYGVDAGNTFGGAISMNSLSYMYFPTGRTEERGRGRGFYMLGYHGTPGASPGKRIDYVNIQSQGNSIKFGDLTANRYTMGAGASSTRGLFNGGYVEGNSPDTDVNIIEFITIATEGTAKDFGDRTQVGRVPACASNDTRCVMASAFTPSGYQNTIDFVTIASIGNASDFGDLSSARAGMSMSCNSTTRGIFNGGYQPAPTAIRVNNMEYITFATTGNSQDFGDLTDDSQSTTGGTASSGTRGLIGLGYVHPSRVNKIDFCTIATTGNASDFGDLTAAKADYGSCSNSIRGLFFGGQTPSYINNIDMVIIATAGNATDFGDVTIGVTAIGAAGSDSHGGLS